MSNNNTTSHTLYNVAHSAQALALAESIARDTRSIIHISHHDRDLEVMKAACRFFLPDTTIYTFPAWDCLPYDRASPSNAILAQRISALSGIAHSFCEEPRAQAMQDEAIQSKTINHSGDSGLPRQATPPSQYIILTTVSAITQKLPPRDIIAAASLHIEKSSNLHERMLQDYLLHNGYQRVSKVMEPGEYALRGNIIDIFPAGAEHGLRIDLFGDEIESIRSFDPLSQRSLEHIEHFILLPMNEVLLSDTSIEQFRSGYRDSFGAITKEDPLYESISHSRIYSGMEHWLPLFYSQLNTLFDYVDDPVIFLAHQTDKTRQEREELLLDYFQARELRTNQKNIGLGAPYHPLPPERLYILDKEWHALLKQYTVVNLSPFDTFCEEHSDEATQSKTKDFSSSSGLPRQAIPSSQHAPSLNTRTSPNFAQARKEAGGHVIEKLASTIRIAAKPILIAAQSTGSCERLTHMLEKTGVTPRFTPHWRDALRLKPTECGITILPITQGFETPYILCYCEQDILGERIIRTTSKRKASDVFMLESANTDIGELVVHKEHGIGRFEGLITMEAAGTRHDCLKLIYADDDKLFLPVENIDMISRYGSESDGVQLDKLGSAAWQSRKAKMKNRIKMAAEELLSIAAKRALKQGRVVETNEAYDEFSSRFPYEPTDDQQRAIDESIADLSSGTPMDRLICGDVGFGKTEIAMRAAFAAVTDIDNPMQVAVVVPTTLLARQHYHSFKERFAGFPINVRMLSRLTKNKEAMQTKDMLADGRCQIVIGTHAVLAPAISFQNLGLVVVDEEQRFGVKQKESFKNLRANVHVLTLSATPIPRTLQMALSGVRELSLITTPPVDRLAVRSFVMPQDPVVLKEALLREYHRGGKTFYVTPRIKYMEQLHTMLRELVPELSIAQAHGQMTPKELDTVMNDFYDDKYDILLSTTIIESGIDIPTANTMIIDRADMYGLAQLYQLRGRVGRAKTRAYCYFTLSPRKTLTDNAIKRLEVMQKLDTLGAGFSLASHDMDIRGFGNLLGEEQSGHVREVGVELYQQMLEEAIAKAKDGHDIEEEIVEDADFSPTIKLGASALIPESYIEDLSLRMGLYRRIAHLHTEEEINAFAAELTDRFGSFPDEVRQLLDTIRIKQLCKQACIDRIDAGPKGAVLSFYQNQFANPTALVRHAASQPTRFKLRTDQKLVVIANWKNITQRMEGVSAAIEEIAGL